MAQIVERVKGEITKKPLVRGLENVVIIAWLNSLHSVQTLNQTRQIEVIRMLNPYYFSSAFCLNFLPPIKNK